MNYIYGHIAAWAPLENNQAPDKLGLLRAQQMFFVTAPLHTLAIFQGTQDSWKILFAAKDASRWASFDSINAITGVEITILRRVSSRRPPRHHASDTLVDFHIGDHHRQIMGPDHDGHAVLLNRRRARAHRHREEAFRRDRALARRRHELRLPLSNSSTVGGHVLPQEGHFLCGNQIYNAFVS